MNHYTNKKSLALLGHSKLKAFLPFTLLLIGLLVGMNGAYAQEYEGGKLQMSKHFISTSPDNTEGDLWLETYVTGAHIVHSVAVPSDIVLVLDMSYSMRDAFSSDDPTPRVEALNASVVSFLNSIYNHDIEGAGQNGKIGHRVSIVAFSSQNATTLYSITGDTPSYGNVTDAQCRTSLCEITSNNQINSVLATTAVNRIVRGNTNIGTYAQYGLNLAYRVLSTRTVKTYFDDENVEHDRGTSVVFFTDGYVGGANTPAEFYIPYNTNSTSANQAAEADAAVYQANRIKSITGTVDNTKRPTIFSVGIFPGADPHAAYVTTYSNSQGGNGQDRYRGYYHNPDQAANGMMHMVSSDYDYVPNMTEPTYSTAGYFRNNTTSNANVANRFFYTDPDTGDVHESKFFKAEDQEGLNAIFEAIASEAGTPPISMTEQTLVQDVISSSFSLPPHPDGLYHEDDIEVYAVKCVAAVVDETTGDVVSCTFEDGTVAQGYDPNHYGTRTSRDANNNILYLDLINNPGGDDNGAVNEQTAEGKENRLRSSDVVTIQSDADGNPQIQITGFNFTAMYCGLEGNDVPRGRKLVIKIPIRVKEGSWGDGFITNGPLSYVTPDGGVTIYGFEVPIIDVIGSVWTEKVTSRPSTFPVVTGDGSGQTVDIGTPEELAWFISEVNGRIHYQENNTVASHPKLSGRLTADIDMSAHNWVPIGAGYKCDNNDHYLDANGDVTTNPNAYVNIAYEGTFDGNGHVITGLKNNVAKYYKVVEGYDYNVVVFPGMFSNVKGTVKNVFVLDAEFHARNHYGEKETFKHFGIIADTLTGGQIFNCEAVGRLICDNADSVYTNGAGTILDTQLQRDSETILGGLVGYNNGGTIHSCMAMAELTGYAMGGMIGQNDGSFTNGFTNGVYNYLDNKIDDVQIVKPVGGIAATNTSSISNCYVRFSRQSSNLTKATFGQVVGSGSFTGASCYTPRYSDDDYDDDGEHVLDRPDYTAWNNTIPKEGASANKYSNTRNPGHMRGDRSNDNMVGGTWHEEQVTDSEGEVQGSLYVILNGTPLLDKLNDGKGTGASWKRTTAGSYSNSPNGGDINGDYPVLVYNGYTCLAGNTGGIGVDYAASLDEMLDRHNNYTLNTASTWNNDQYKNTKVNALKGGAINLFANETTSKGTNATAGTVVYIDENVSLLQTTNAPIDAYTCQYIIDYGSTYDIQSGNRWHNVSSSLQNSMTGLTYTITEDVTVPSALGSNWAGFKQTYDAANGYDLDPRNPCRVKAEQNNDDAALFPADMRQWKPFDFYTFFEPKYHWINFKRNSSSHWHMDKPLEPIEYYHYLNGTKVSGNETQLIPGKGYLLALHFEYFANWHMWTGDKKDRTLLQNRGTLNNGDITIPVTYTADNEWTGLAGYNLLGNPYQSYLDFDEFAEVNSGLWGESDNFAKTYAVFDPSDMTTNGTGATGGTYVQYMATSSKGSATASRYLNMHQGFFIQVNKNIAADATATFNNDMRSNTATGVEFRGEQPAYPLINFKVTDYEGNTDIAVLELNRPENDGAKKLRMGSPAGRIYFRYDNTNLAIYFRNSDKDYQTLNFAAEEDGNFTLSWNTANADFSSLTLVDNITGIKTDMLTHDHYTFEGRVDDYNTRFKIVFGEMDTNDEEEPVLEHFAFFDHGNLIVNGTGHFEVVDVMGRVLYAVELTDTQNTVSLPSNVRGVCMLCFTRNNETMVQKMVIQ